MSQNILPMTTTESNTEANPIDVVLGSLISIEEVGSNNSILREKILSLKKKLASNQLKVAVLGQMKRGKSSFINALLGAEIVPTGVLPVTAIITEIKYATAPTATIIYSADNVREQVNLDALSEYITEAGNPGNKKQVVSVEISYPSPFLENGTVLIDTPGIGSTHAHNTQTTESYLQNVDAGIVVLSVEPPITETESQFVRNVKEDIPKLFFILNKIDQVSSSEITVIKQFLQNELDRLQIDPIEIFPLSARKSLREKKEGNGVSDTGRLRVFEHRLRTFLSNEKERTLALSVALDALHIARTLKFAASIGFRAQAMSSEELHRKRQEIDRLLGQAESQARDLSVLLHQYSGELLGRVERDLTNQVEISAPVVRQHLKLFQNQHPKETGRSLAALLESFLTEEIRAIFQRWRIREDEEIQVQLNLLSDRMAAQANGILEQLQKAAGSLFEVPIEPVSIACSLRVESHLYYKVEPVFYSLDRFLLILPRFCLRAIVFRKINAGIWRLLDMNAGRIRYDYLERLQASMNQFEKDISAAITMMTESLRSALFKPNTGVKNESALLSVLDSAIRDCSQLLQ